MVNSSSFIIGLFLLTLSLSSIDVGLASRKLFQYKPPSNGLEGLKKTLNDVQKLVNSNSATKLSEADLKQIQSLLKQIHDLIPKPGTAASKGTPSTPRFSRRLSSINPKPLLAMEKLSRKRNLLNIAAIVHPSGLLQPIRPPQQKTRKLSQILLPDNGPKPQPAKLPNLPHVHFPKPAGGSRRLSQLPTTLPNPFAGMAQPATGQPRLPTLPQFPQLHFPKPGRLPPLPSPKTRTFSFHWNFPNPRSASGTTTTPNIPGAQTTNPSTSTTGASQPMHQGSGAESANPSTTQASQPMDQASGNTAGPQTMQSSQPMNQQASGMPNRLLSASTIPNKPNRVMPNRMMASSTLQGILNHGSNRLGYTGIPKYSR